MNSTEKDKNRKTLTIDVFEKQTPFPEHSAFSPQLSDLTVTFSRTHCGPHKSDTTDIPHNERTRKRKEEKNTK